RWFGLARVAAMSAAWHPESQPLFTRSADGVVRQWEPATGKQVRELATGAGPSTAVALSPDGKTLAWGQQDGTVRLWDTAQGKEGKSIATRMPLLSALAL